MGYIESIRAKVGHDRIITVGVGVYVIKDGKVLLQKRKDNATWATHGGGIELGESAEQTAARELYEETGLVAESLELLGVFSGEATMHTYPNGDQIYAICVHYICRNFSGEINVDTDEVLELKWFDINDLPLEIHPPDIPSFKAFTELMCGGAQ